MMNISYIMFWKQNQNKNMIIFFIIKNENKKYFFSIANSFH